MLQRPMLAQTNDDETFLDIRDKTKQGNTVDDDDDEVDNVGDEHNDDGSDIHS